MYHIFFFKFQTMFHQHLIIVFFYLPDLFRPVLCSCKPLQETPHLFRKGHRVVQREEAP